MNPYPEASEAVDKHLSKAIESLETTTKDGFRRVEGQMQNMATKDAVNAQVARLDLRVDHVAERTDAGLAAVEEKMVAGFSNLEARDAKRDQEARDRDEDRDKKVTRRVGWLFAAAGLGFTTIQFAINNWPS